MVAKKGLVGVMAAIGAAMLFVVSAAGASFGGNDVDDAAVAGSAGDEYGLDAVGAGPEQPGADGRLQGHVLDNSSGEGIAGATVVIIHIPEDARDADAYVEKVLSVLRRARDRLGEGRETLRAMEQRLQEKKADLLEKLAARGIFIVRTDENGSFVSRAATNDNVIVAVATGYRPGRLAVEVPVSDGIAPTLRLDAKPGLEVYKLKLVWGFIDEINREGDLAAWNGSAEVSDGTVRLLRTIQFETGGRFANGCDDKIYPQKEQDTLSWRSSTTVARDGVVVIIMVPAGSGNPAVTLTAGEWSKTVRLARLEGDRFRIPVGDAGHEVLVACELFDRPAA